MNSIGVVYLELTLYLPGNGIVRADRLFLETRGGLMVQEVTKEAEQKDREEKREQSHLK